MSKFKPGDRVVANPHGSPTFFSRHAGEIMIVEAVLGDSGDVSIVMPGYDVAQAIPEDWLVKYEEDKKKSTWRVEVERHEIVRLVVDVEADSEEEARKKFEEDSMNGKYEEDWAEAERYAEITEEYVF